MARPRWDATVAIVGLVLVAAWTIYRTVVASGQPGHYYQFRNHHEGFEYPTGAVVRWCAIVVVELAVAIVFLLREKRTAATCVAMGLLHGVLVLGGGIFAMHAPPYYGGFIVYQFFAAIWLILAAIISAVGRLARRVDRG